MATMTLRRADTLLTRRPPVYGISDVERLLEVRYTTSQIRALKTIPFSEDVLRECAGTHMLFPGFPFTLLGLRERFAGMFYTPEDGWYAEEEERFSRQEVPLRWHLLRTGPLPGSLGATADEQRELLGPHDVIPVAPVAAFAAILHFFATGDHLFGPDWHRTADRTARGNWVVLRWDRDRLYLGPWGGYPSDSFGSLAARSCC